MLESDLFEKERRIMIDGSFLENRIVNQNQGTTGRGMIIAKTFDFGYPG